MNLRSHRLHRVAMSVLALVACNVSAGSPGFIDLRDTDPIHGNADAVRDKLEQCTACHGAGGHSAVPIFPNIAGLPAEYLYWQLVEYKREADPESPMTALVATLSDQDMRDYAAWYAALAPAAPVAVAGDGAQRGAVLYRDGDAEAGVPPCQGCHGADAGGHPLAASDFRYRLYPPLRGQHSAYIAQRLKDFRDGKNTLTSNDRIMQGVARGLSDEDAQALADWVQGAR